jgi:poly-gamma-glutamate synthesis protein (capsule biosynthesis protein)
MRLVDDFGADDDASVTADNTSAFNCRPVTGGTRWSQHSYGRAIDVNPFENPYVTDGSVLVPGSATYVDRSNVRPGMILAGDAVVDAFTSRGWTWGGSWTSPIDYQHFSTSGG